MSLITMQEPTIPNPVYDAVSEVLKLIFASRDGDQWLLVRTRQTSFSSGTSQARNQAQPSDITIPLFLAGGGDAPQKRALRDMLTDMPSGRY